MTAPAALEVTGIHVVHKYPLPVDDVDLALVLVELEPALLRQHLGLGVVLFHLHAFRRTPAEIPHEFALAGELENAVLRRQAADPDITFAVRDDRLQARRPVGMMVRVAPGVNDVGVRIHGDDFRTLGAAGHPIRLLDAARDLVPLGAVGPVQEPDNVHVIHVDAGHLLHAPAVRQRAGPERIDLEQRCAILVHGLDRVLGLGLVLFLRRCLILGRALVLSRTLVLGLLA